MSSKGRIEYGRKNIERSEEHKMVGSFSASLQQPTAVCMSRSIKVPHLRVFIIKHRKKKLERSNLMLQNTLECGI